MHHSNVSAFISCPRGEGGRARVARVTTMAIVVVALVGNGGCYK